MIKQMFILILIVLILSLPAYSIDVILFSGKISPSDSDNDGVIDSIDKCPNTPMGFKVDINGCSSRQFCGLIIINKKPLIIINKKPRDFYKCWEADWLENEPRRRYPNDCQIVRTIKTNKYYCRDTKWAN